MNAYSAKNNCTETYEIVSKVAYLTGVGKQVFETQHEPFQMEQFKRLSVDKNARIIRNLCMLRTAIEHNFSRICYAMRYEMKSLYALPTYIPMEALMALEQDGILLVKANRKLNQYVIDINQHIANRINNCKTIFPAWLNWGYIRELFIMPNGFSETGIKLAAAEFYEHKYQYPYQIYLNWAASGQGNIFANDKKFVTLLYEQHGERFGDFSKVSDAGILTKSAICSFLERGNRNAIVVDCENADPYRFFSMLDSLSKDMLLNHVAKIILYNDVHASSAWKTLHLFTDIPVEHHMTERIKENKSLVDIQLATGVCREHYENGVDAVVLLSSDSDFWGMISMMPQIHFLVMLEHEKCSQAIKTALDNAEIQYCYLDTFCTANTGKMVASALMNEIQNALNVSLNVNLLDLLEQAYQSARASMSNMEKEKIFAQYLKKLQIIFAEDGRPVIQMR